MNSGGEREMGIQEAGARLHADVGDFLERSENAMVEGREIRKKALVISYEFPPMGAIGSIWVTKYLKFLPRFGWHPVVVTVRNPPTYILDLSLERDLPPDMDVYRTFSLEPNRLVRVARNMKRLFKQNKTMDDEQRIIYSYTGMRLSTLARLKSFFIPDEKIGWLPFAVMTAMKAARKHGVGVIFSTGPPYTTNLIGLICSVFTGIPWVCEFKDPWVDNPVNMPAGRLNRNIFLALESIMLKVADGVICAMPAQIEWFKKRFGSIYDGKTHLITNGFDPDDFIQNTDTQQRFTITYMGKIYHEMYPRTLLDALNELIEEGNIDREDIRLRCIGALDVDSNRLFQRERLKSIIEVTGYIDHSECIRLMQRSHLLLLQLAEGETSRVIYTAKMFEYLGARRPILALVGEGASKELIESLDVGTVVRPSDFDGIKRAVLSYYRHYKAGGEFVIHQPRLDEFNRERQAERLAEVFDHVAQSRGA